MMEQKKYGQQKNKFVTKTKKTIERPPWDLDPQPQG